jgi:LPXTG-motif cell wall-anchored protein
MRANEALIKIVALQQKNNVTYLMIGGIQLLGGIAGVVYAKKKNYSAIAKIAMFFVGAIVSGIPANAILQPKIIEREAEIELIKLESKTEI